MRLLASMLIAAAALMAPPAPAFADCKCLANGRVYDHGQLACLRLPNGDQLARCDKVLNNSSWKKVRDGCPQVMLPPRRDDLPAPRLRSFRSAERAG